MAWGRAVAGDVSGGPDQGTLLPRAVPPMKGRGGSKKAIVAVRHASRRNTGVAKSARRSPSPLSRITPTPECTEKLMTPNRPSPAKLAKTVTPEQLAKALRRRTRPYAKPKPAKT